MNIEALKKLAGVIYKMPSKRYLTYIRSPQWARIRQEHLALTDYWCESCRAAKACQVHHWNYQHLGNEMPWDLYAVCPRCHQKLHTMVMPEPANDNKQGDLLKAV